MFAWEMNQALAQLGMVAGGVAFLLWSLDFLGRREAEPRLIGLAGLLAGAFPILLLVAGWVALNVGGALFLYAVHGAWAALVGLHLVRGKLDPNPLPFGERVAERSEAG